MDLITNMNRAALARVLFGKSLLPWPAVEANKRNNRTIPDNVFRDVILSGLREKGLTAWVYFYNYGKDMCAQMSFQLEAFRRATYPVLIMQGNEDKGQVDGYHVMCNDFICLLVCMLLHVCVYVFIILVTYKHSDIYVLSVLNTCDLCSYPNANTPCAWYVSVYLCCL